MKLFAIFIAFCVCSSLAIGQDAAQQAAIQAAQAEAMQRAAAVQQAMPQGQAQPMPGVPGSTKPGDKSGAEKPGDEKSQSKAKSTEPITRPKKPDAPPAPIEQQVTVSDGKVVFNLAGQSWQQVLQWLADTSKLSLDWQELPGDSMNLTTTRSYTLEEARDMINRHLLARGYSIVVNGELMSVVKLAELKTSLVPRVAPEELANQQPHTLCKTSFDLSWLIADEAVTEFAPLLTKAGKINKLSRTNRLEIMDTAQSLQEIYRILQAEQSKQGQEQLVKAFRLKNRRANEVIVLLQTLLGLEVASSGSSSGGGRGSMGGMQQMQQQMQMQMQQMQQQAAAAAGGGKSARKQIKTRLVLNQRENMILAQAAPDQMAIIVNAIDEIDVEVANEDSLLNNMSKLKVYELQTIDPQTVVDLLQDVGDMSPGTVLKVDKDKKAIVAVASLADHLTITTLVERIDQSGREVEVIPLRRLEAEYVAGTIRALMAPPEQENSNRTRYFSPWSSMQSQQPKEKKFRVEADIEYNRLLVNANKVEMADIRELLTKLGEISDPGTGNGLRTFELSPTEDPQKLREQLERLWRGRNKLEFDFPKPPPAEDPTTTRADRKNAEAEASNDPLTQAEFFRLLEERPAQVAAAMPEPPAIHRTAVSIKQDDDAPPVKFSIGPDGKLVITSDDPLALSEAEKILQEVIKPRAGYRVYTLKYAMPSWIAMNLRDYFESEAETNSSPFSFDPFFGLMARSQKQQEKASLGKRRIPQFIEDNFTSTILVRNADRRQYQVIEDLIKLYDVPEPADTRAMRVTKVFKLKNAQATIVAQAIKDVFRDLLSANDKALQQQQGEQKETRVISYFDDGGEDDDSPIRFKGLLSIGFDNTSNTLVISSTAALMESVETIIEALDESADRASTIRVLQLDSTVDLNLLEERLNKALKKNTAGKQRPGQQNNDQQNQQNAAAAAAAQQAARQAGGM